MTNPRRILIVRLSALGDVIFATSLLAALREAWPQSHIAWIAQKPFGEIIKSDARLDELITLEPQSLCSAGEVMKLRQQLREQQFDLIIDAQGTLKSNIISSLCGAKKVGFAAKRVGKLLMDQAIPKGGDIADISSEYRYLGKTLTGIDTGAPQLELCTEQKQRGTYLMEKHGIPQHFMALCPFTTRPEKHWEDEQWSALIALLQEAGKPCVIFGGADSQQRAAQINDGAKNAAIDMTGKTSIADLPSLFEAASQVIGVDTGLTHLGVALRKPVTILYGATQPYLQGTNSPLKVLFFPVIGKEEREKLTAKTVFQQMTHLREPAR